MAQRLPTVGGDTNAWGTVLNGYLGVAHNADGTPLNGITKLYNVEADYGAVPDEYRQDGVTVTSDNTFTSASAAFVAGDVGKCVTIWSAGASSAQPHTSTISSINSSTSVELADAPGYDRTHAKWWINRGGDPTTAIQNAIDAAAAAGGGKVYLPGVGYAITGLVLKNRVWLEGAGHGATTLRLLPSSNKPVIRTDYTTDNSAALGGVRMMRLIGARGKQSHVTTTLASQYTAGDTTMVLTDASNFLPWGTVTVGTSRYKYVGISGNTLQQVNVALENTVDATYAGGTTVTHPKAHGIYLYRQPPTTEAADTQNEVYDPTYYLENLFIIDVKGDGIMQYGQSLSVFNNIRVEYAEFAGIRPSFDCAISNVTVGNCFGPGLWMDGAQQHLTNVTAYYCGWGTWAYSGQPPTAGFMFESRPPTADGEGMCVMTNCLAQDNFGDGFYIKYGDRVMMSGCGASSNGRRMSMTVTISIATPAVITSNNHLLNIGDQVIFKTTGALPTGIVAGTSYYIISAGFGANSFEISATPGGAAVNTSGTQSGTHSFAGGTYAGVRMFGCEDSIIEFTSTERRVDGTNSFQRNALRIDATSTNNQIRLTHDSVTAATVNAAISPDSSLAGGNDVRIGSMGGMVTPAFATPYTPDPYLATTHKPGVLTSALTVNAPTNAHLGCPLRFILVQDGTGGRNVTWNGAFSTTYANTGNTLNKKLIIEFVYDGSVWQQTYISQSATAGTYWI